MSSELVRKQGFKLKQIKRPIYIRNVDDSFNKERLIKCIVKMNIYYQRENKNQYNWKTEVECDFENTITSLP